MLLSRMLTSRFVPVNTKRAGRNQCARACVIAALVAEPELLNQLTVRIDIRPSQIVQQPATLAYHLQEALATVMVLSVLAEMFRQVIDAFSKDRNLNLGGPGVVLMGPVLLNCWRFVECHCEPLSLLFCRIVCSC